MSVAHTSPSLLVTVKAEGVLELLLVICKHDENSRYQLSAPKSRRFGAFDIRCDILVSSKSSQYGFDHGNQKRQHGSSEMK